MSELMSRNLPQQQGALLESAASASFGAALAGGIAAIVLSIIGLSHYTPTVMAAIAILALGAAFALNGGLLALGWAHWSAQVHAAHGETAEYLGGLSAEAVTGVAAIVLAILVLLNVDAAALLPVATLVLGIGAIFGSGMLAWMNSTQMNSAQRGERTGQGQPAVILAFAAVVQILAGLAAIALSILALIGFLPLELSLVTLLVLGTANVLCGASAAGRTLGRAAA